MGDTSIQWTSSTWNPVRGCSRVSPGCGGAAGEGGCYAERQAYRFAGKGMPYEGLVRLGKQGPRWTGKVNLVRDKLMEPFGWRKPRRVFVNSMSDLFHENLSDEDIDQVFATMLICSLHEDRGGHTFQILTKRADRMQRYITGAGKRPLDFARICGQRMDDGDGWHDTTYNHVRDHGLVHPKIWLGVSVEDQQRADERVEQLCRTPAAVRFLSCEPLLGPVNIGLLGTAPADWGYGYVAIHSLLHWVIVGGESGPGARPMHLDWLRAIVQECRAANTPVFAKQMGRRVLGDSTGFEVDRWILPGGGEWVPPIIGPHAHAKPANAIGFKLYDGAGGEPEEWPEDLRIREFPEVRA